MHTERYLLQKSFRLLLESLAKILLILLSSESSALPDKINVAEWRVNEWNPERAHCCTAARSKYHHLECRHKNFMSLRKEIKDSTDSIEHKEGIFQKQIFHWQFLTGNL